MSEANAAPLAHVSTGQLAPSASQVGLTVLGRPGSAFGNEVRHIIAARDEARPHALAADQQGRWSLPAQMVFAGGWGMAVGEGLTES